MDALIVFLFLHMGPNEGSKVNVNTLALSP